MFYFIRTTVIYLALFIGLSIGVQKAFQYYYADDLKNTKHPSALMTSGVSPYVLQPRTTQTGLLLAGAVAQNRRDWGTAWKSFSTLNEQFDGNPTYALRAFTLALGNGQFDQSLSIAQKLDNDYFSENAEETQIEAFDLARLFLILDDVRQGKVEIDLEQLKNGAVSKFVNPIIRAWTQTDIENTSKKLDQVQIYHMGLAADFYGDPVKAEELFDDLNEDNYTSSQIKTLVSFYVRHNKVEKAIALLDGTENKDLLGVLEILQNTPKSYKPNPEDDFHLNGVNAGLSLAFHDFAKIMMVEHVIDSALLFSRLASYMDEKSPSVYITIGNILKYQGQDDSAIDAYKKVGQLDPLYDMAITNYVDILNQQKNYKYAEKLLNRAIEKNPKKPIYHYLIGGIYKVQKKYQKAIDAYDSAEAWGLQDGELERELWPLYYSRAIVFDLDGRWSDAERDLMTALEKFPNSPIILNYLGYAYADKNINLDKAKEMISKAVMAAPNDGYIIDSMGWILYRMGDYEEALKYLERAARIRPYHMVINDHLGDVYWKVGRKLEAKYMWQRALDYYDDTEEEQQRMIDETRRKVKEGI